MKQKIADHLFLEPASIRIQTQKKLDASVMETDSLNTFVIHLRTAINSVISRLKSI